MELENPKTQEPLGNTTLKKSTFGQGRPRLMRDRLSRNHPKQLDKYTYTGRRYVSADCHHRTHDRHGNRPCHRKR